MKKNVLLIAMLFFLFSVGKSSAQSLVCNDLVQISVNANCYHEIIPEEILEGTLFPNCIVELDKTPPYGNGPWVAPILGPADINKTYQVRVRHLPSGNMCWGSMKAEDKLPPVLICDQISLVDINGSTPLTVNSSSLNITAADNCSATTLSPATLQYDCDDLGLKVVQFTAADEYVNTATCQHTVLVTNSQSCDACVSVCPPSIVVSYNQGNNELLPAFQANNLAPFDAFGSALSDDACGVIDSSYSVDYQFGTSGTSWFSRRWFWVTATGGFPTCEQIIAFSSAQKVKVEGKIFIDADTDCATDAGEQGVQIFPLKITKLPSGASETIYPNADGTYSKDIFFTNLDASAEVSLVLPNNITSVCPSAISIPTTTNQSVVTFDVGLQTGGECPQLKVELGNSILRRCFTNYFSVNYCNIGLDTAYNAFVTVNLDPLIQLVASNVPYTVSGPDSVYTFQLGNVSPFYCGSFYIQGYVSCAATLGQTLCSEATIYPNTPCGGAYLGPELSASAVCEGDSVSLMLRNIGNQDMQQPENYIVVEDFIMYQDGAIQLPAGDSITIKVPSNGATWRIETEQVPTYPVAGLVAAAIEGCGGLNTPGLINAFGLGDNPIWYDELCVQVVGSYDPNDKAAIPVGYSDQHFIRANEPIEYKIRFQNTGTDTAFRVVVVDTLSNFLNLNTLEAGASSHPYRLDVYPGGILHFVFDPIALPDSNVNEPASNGFLYFRITQKADLPDGTFIENSAGIYFDFNDPVITNTVFHTVGYPFVSLPPLVFTAQSAAPSCHNSADGTIQVTMTGGMPPYNYQWSNPNLQGSTPANLPAGMYTVTVSDNNGAQFVETFNLTAPPQVTAEMGSTPSIDNLNNGEASVSASGGKPPQPYVAVV